jgi:two-component system sensor kinase FixL
LLARKRARVRQPPILHHPNFPWLLPAAAVLLALAIFAVDTFTPFGMAVAVLYVLVILIAANFCDRRQLLAVGLGCVALTLLAFSVTHGIHYETTAFARCLISIAAIGITTLLVERNKSAEMVLREQANLLAVTHDAVFVRDANDVIRYWNHGAEELYGWSAEEAIGQVSHRLMRSDFPIPLRAITRILERDGKWEGEITHTKRDGSGVLVASRWSIQRGEHGRLPAILETNNDITAARRAEEELRQAQSNLAHVNRVSTLGEMTASIAHEVSQPIAAMVASAGAGQRWLTAGNIEEVQQSLARISKDGHRASEVISRIRALSMKRPPRKEQVDIDDAIREVLALVRDQAERNHTELRTELSPDLPPINVDRIQIQQVLLNLIVNAVEAMGTNDDADREVLVCSRGNGSGGVEVVVQDTGPGLVAAQMAQVFDAFYTTKSNGIGMGLAICRSIIEAHDGSLGVTHNEPRGAVFQFSLPSVESTVGSVS